MLGLGATAASSALAAGMPAAKKGEKTFGYLKSLFILNSFISFKYVNEAKSINLIL